MVTLSTGPGSGLWLGVGLGDAADMNELLRMRAAAAGGVFTTADADLCGYDRRGLRRLVSSGACQRVSRGRYAVPVTDASPEEEHLARTRAVLLGGADRVAASHHSALLLHGLPVFGVDLGVVHLVRLADRHTRRGDGVAHHVRPPGTTVRQVAGWPAVDLATALVQHAMVHGILPGVVSADAALHARRVTRAELSAAVGRVRGVPGSRAAGHMVRHADGRSESVGETRLRLGMLVLGIHLDPQHKVDEGGQVFASADFLVRGTDVVVEFDGLLKYRGDRGADAVVAEKIREDRIRGLGYTVVRVTWAELAQPEWVAARIRSAVARSRR